MKPLLDQESGLPDINLFHFCDEVQNVPSALTLEAVEVIFAQTNPEGIISASGGPMERTKALIVGS